MASALVPLANTTLGSGVSSVTFSSINQTYRDLLLIVSNITASSSYVYASLRFNGSSSNYNYVVANGNGSSSSSYAGSSLDAIFMSSITNYTTASKASEIIHIMDYVQTDKHKTVLARSSDAATGVEMLVGRWADTSAITSLTILTSGAPAFASGMTIALYGVSA